MKKLIVANWKMNPRTFGAAERLLSALEEPIAESRARVVFCPPAAYIARLKKKFPKLEFGAQDAFYENEGAYTGAMGPEILKSVGSRFIIVGHSERRYLFGEDDKLVAKKLQAVLDKGLNAILCVGEPLKVRRKGLPAARRFVSKQVSLGLKCLKATSAAARLTIAYEPVWAISTSGSGMHEDAEDAVEMIRRIKKKHRGRVLYGGSINSQNINEFIERGEIDGFLIGGASLRAREFKKIIDLPTPKRPRGWRI